MEHLEEINQAAKTVGTGENLGSLNRMQMAGMSGITSWTDNSVDYEGRIGPSSQSASLRMGKLENELQKKDEELLNLKSRLEQWKHDTANRLYRKLRNRMTKEFDKYASLHCLDSF